MTKCKNCKEVRDDPVNPSRRRSSKKCFLCKKSGCDKCIPIVCCDCCVRMCNDCRDGEENCGCYGTCSRCGGEVNRGEHGWPCTKCKKWYCDDEDCRKGNRCKECR